MMRLIWERHARCVDGIDGARDELLPGATPGEIDAAEAALGITFPSAFRDAYLAHDGQVGILFLFAFYRLWPVKDIVAITLNLRDQLGDDSGTCGRSGKIKDCIMSSGWIAFGDNGGSATLALDLDPGDDGKPGQIIELLEDGRAHLFDSFEEFLARIVRDIESGALRWDETAGLFAPASFAGNWPH